METNQHFLAVPAALVESEIHDGVTQSEAVAIAHLEVPVGAVGRVRGDGDVEGRHAGDVDVFLKRSVRHGDGFRGGDHGGAGGAQIGRGNFHVLGVKCRVGGLKAPAASVVLHLHPERRRSALAFEVPVKPVQHLIGPVPS